MRRREAEEQVAQKAAEFRKQLEEQSVASDRRGQAEAVRAGQEGS